MPIRRHLIIEGRVQGVGFRYGLRKVALERGCSGWVRNRADGSVEALVAGQADAVDAVVAWAHAGPRGARVSRVVLGEPSEDLPAAGDPFTQLPSM
jgi:acylphosphatase